MVSSDDEYVDEDHEFVTVSKRAPPRHLQNVQEYNSQSPSEGLASPKRQASDDTFEQRLLSKRRKVKAKALDSEVVTSYGNLLSEEVDAFVGNDLVTSEHPAAFRARGSNTGDGATQYGAVRWSPAEKAKFFYLLDRKGRHDLPVLSRAVGKSVPEIADYLRALQEGYRSRHLLADDMDLYRYDEIPAAVDLGIELQEALDATADQVAMDELERYRRRAKRTYGEKALIDFTLAGELSSSAATIEPTLAESRGTFDMAVALLDLPKLVWLSESVFMNSKHEDLNWSHIAPQGTRPSIFHTACIDLANLVVSITEKLVSTAHFLALSRVRAIEAGRQRQISPIVRRADVLAALDILRMPINPKAIWRECPRKCQLQVVEYSSRNRAITKYLTYEEVESAMSRASTAATLTTIDNSGSAEMEDNEPDGPFVDTGPSSRLSREKTKDNPTGALSGSQRLRAASHVSVRTNNESTESASARSSQTPNIDSDASNAGDKKQEKEDEVAMEEDNRIEQLDQQQNKQEEASLWALLGCQNPPDGELTSTEQVFPTGRKRWLGQGRRLSEKELTDWRVCCQYESQWEQYSQPLEGGAFHYDLEPKHDELSEEYMADYDDTSLHDSEPVLTDEDVDMDETRGSDDEGEGTDSENESNDSTDGSVTEERSQTSTEESS